MKKILLIRHKHFSYVDISVFKQLVKNFPEYDVVLFNVDEIHRKISKPLMVLNLFYMLNEYGWDFITGQKKLKTLKTFFKSTRLFTCLYRRHVNEHVKANNYEFVFQLQSLFDGSTSGVHHFVYSDHITIANYTYPDINPNEYIRSKKFIKVEKSLYQHSALCFTWSNNIAKLISEAYKVSPSKIKCVYAGNNVDLYDDGNLKKFSNQHILFVGVDWIRKGGPMLLEAFKQIQKELPDAVLTIVGCSPKVNIKNVQVAGRVPLEQMPQYYNSASVFCLPTLREPFGLVFVESMLYRLPIVANNIGALPDLIENGYNGFLVDNNLRDYVDVLVRLLKNPDLCKQLGDNGCIRAKERFTWDIVGNKIRDEVMGVLKK